MGTQYSFYDVCTGQQSDEVLEAPKTVIVVALGGGTFVEHELMNNLAAEV